ncbi:tetratricopeptide repeat protein [Polynucleobacter sp. MWH-UH23A]|uniref:tetratricopeptide repeat protein n=1 Tax=Polynucleobacter sp. MWH-UH23A TaxID=1855613 RepID=UPI003364C74C
MRLNPKDLVALQVQGLAMAMQGKVAESVESFSKAAVLDPKNPELLNNLAKAQHGANLFTDATRTYEKLNRLIPNNAQILTDMGTSYAKLKQFDRAMSSYNKAIDLQDNYFLAWSNRGNLYASMRMTNEAIANFQKALSLNQNFPEAWTNYGNALFDLGSLNAALNAHEKAILLNSNYAEAWANKGNVLLELNRIEESFYCYEKAYFLKPSHPYLYGQLLAAKSNFCIWDSLEPSLDGLPQKITEGGLPASVPFVSLYASTNPKIQKLCSEIYMTDKFGSYIFNPPVRTDKVKKIKLGYFSSDFKDHPVGLLMEGIVKNHNRDKFEIIGYFLNRTTSDPVEINLKSHFDKTYDLFGMADKAVYELLTADPIDIAIDLNGHTSGARTALFAQGLAQIQVNYLGFAGTTGAKCYDALIADSVVIPPSSREYYSEKIYYLPNSFFPADSSIHPDEFGLLPSRDDENLPEKGFVFACFNNAFKINHEIFGNWMKILASIDGSVLWLSKPSSIAINNLQSQAAHHGIDPGRIVFASRVPSRVSHLNRLRLADLFLDTNNYNAHTTAADALWSGVPVLTQIGNTFAARVAASQLTAIGMTELIVASQEEYISKAVELAKKPEKLIAIRNRLEANRFTAPLFNSKQYVQDLEQIYLDLTKSS